VATLKEQAEAIMKQVKTEEMIQTGFVQLPKEIEKMEVDELRTQLVTNAKSYRSEKARN
jgi:hypothetical protein